MRRLKSCAHTKRLFRSYLYTEQTATIWFWNWAKMSSVTGWMHANKHLHIEHTTQKKKEKFIHCEAEDERKRGFSTLPDIWKNACRTDGCASIVMVIQPIRLIMKLFQAMLFAGQYFAKHQLINIFVFNEIMHEPGKCLPFYLSSNKTFSTQNLFRK